MISSRSAKKVREAILAWQAFHVAKQSGDIQMMRFHANRISRVREVFERASIFIEEELKYAS